jgi:hypothetical protein
MANILSIDFDYFIDISAEDRERLFPDGSDEIPHDELKLMWDESYEKYPEIKEIGVIQEYYYLRELLKSLNIKQEHILIADTHKDIKKIIDLVPEGEQINIVNIDFHHDYYHYFTGGDTYNCGNWLRRLVEDRPNTKVKWIRRDDSQISSLEGEFPFEHITNIKSLESDKFDYIFICKSPEWTPPHMDQKFIELVMTIKN